MNHKPPSLNWHYIPLVMISWFIGTLTPLLVLSLSAFSFPWMPITLMILWFIVLFTPPIFVIFNKPIPSTLLLKGSLSLLLITPVCWIILPLLSGTASATLWMWSALELVFLSTTLMSLFAVYSYNIFLQWTPKTKKAVHIIKYILLLMLLTILLLTLIFNLIPISGRWAILIPSPTNLPLFIVFWLALLMAAILLFFTFRLSSVDEKMTQHVKRIDTLQAEIKANNNYNSMNSENDIYNKDINSSLFNSDNNEISFKEYIEQEKSFLNKCAQNKKESSEDDLKAENEDSQLDRAITLSLRETQLQNNEIPYDTYIEQQRSFLNKYTENKKRSSEDDLKAKVKELIQRPSFQHYKARDLENLNHFYNEHLSQDYSISDNIEKAGTASILRAIFDSIENPKMTVRQLKTEQPTYLITSLYDALSDLTLTSNHFITILGIAQYWLDIDLISLLKNLELEKSEKKSLSTINSSDQPTTEELRKWRLAVFDKKNLSP